MMKRIFRRLFSLAPQNVSTTNRRFFESSSVAMSFSTFQLFSLIGLLSFLYSSEVHQIVFSVTASFTKNLSFGERPV